MSQHFKWYDATAETVVPMFARYAFPSQSNKAEKIVPRIPPKNGSVFNPGQTMRFEFPAQGYMNATKTTLEFDVTLFGHSLASEETTRFQNNIQSIFSRARLLYGATPLEDIINYNVVVRALTEWTSTNQYMTMDQTAISEGIGGVVLASDQGGNIGLMNVRSKYIQGNSQATPGAATPPATGANFINGIGAGFVPNRNVYPGGGTVTNSRNTTRRYQISFAFGLFTQEKLIPLKWMASQLAIELTLAQPEACIFTTATDALVEGSPTYIVSQLNMIPELLVFDASYGNETLK